MKTQQFAPGGLQFGLTRIELLARSRACNLSNLFSSRSVTRGAIATMSQSSSLRFAQFAPYLLLVALAPFLSHADASTYANAINSQSASLESAEGSGYLEPESDAAYGADRGKKKPGVVGRIGSWLSRRALGKSGRARVCDDLLKLDRQAAGVEIILRRRAERLNLPFEEPDLTRGGLWRSVDVSSLKVGRLIRFINETGNELHGQDEWQEAIVILAQASRATGKYVVMVQWEQAGGTQKQFIFSNQSVATQEESSIFVQALFKSLGQ